jgi:TonB family protein
MRIVAPLIALALVACANSNQLESAANSTILVPDSSERKCSRPTTELPREAQGSIAYRSPAETILSFEILATGQIGTVKVKSSSGEKLFDDAAVESAKKIKCAPLAHSTQSIWVETSYVFRTR